MQKIELGADGKIELETTLTKGQVSKFNSLVKKLIVENGSAYIPIDELHGVLLTNSRERAKTIVTNHADDVRAFLVKSSDFKEKYGVSGAIKPRGLYNLLEVLAEANPKRATDYRASLALLAFIIAKHPSLALSSDIKAKHNESTKNSVIRRLKKSCSHCQLCEQIFTDDDEKHVHHITGGSEDPSLVNNEDNLIIIKGWIHRDYHDWLNRERLPINKGTLKYYAKNNNFSTRALEAL